MPSQCSRQEVLVYRAFTKGAWLTNRDIARLSEVAYRTVRLHTARLVRAGVLQQEQMFPEYRFALVKTPTAAARAWAARIERAAKIFGM